MRPVQRQRRSSGKGSHRLHDVRRSRTGAVSAGVLRNCAAVQHLPGFGQAHHRPLYQVQRSRTRAARTFGDGEAGVYGGPSGDLYVVLHCKEHEFFERDGRNLHCVIPVSVVQAALGTEITVPTLEGEHVLKVPEGTQTGATFKVKNKGVPELNGRGRGDLFVQLKVQTPTKLSKRQRELLEELQQTLSVENKPVSRTLLSKMREMFS